MTQVSHDPVAPGQRVNGSPLPCEHLSKRNLNQNYREVVDPSAEPLSRRCCRSVRAGGGLHHRAPRADRRRARVWRRWRQSRISMMLPISVAISPRCWRSTSFGAVATVVGSRVWGWWRRRGRFFAGGGAAGAARQLQRIRNGQIMTALWTLRGFVALILWASATAVCRALDQSGISRTSRRVFRYATVIISPAAAPARPWRARANAPAHGKTAPQNCRNTARRI